MFTNFSLVWYNGVMEIQMEIKLITFTLLMLPLFSIFTDVILNLKDYLGEQKSKILQLLISFFFINSYSFFFSIWIWIFVSICFVLSTSSDDPRNKKIITFNLFLPNNFLLGFWQKLWLINSSSVLEELLFSFKEEGNIFVFRNISG